MNIKILYIFPIVVCVLAACSKTEEKQTGNVEITPDSLALKYNSDGANLMLDAIIYAGTEREAIYDSALEFFNKAISIDSTFKAPFSNKVKLYISTGQLNKAVKTLEQIERLDPSFAEAHLQEAFILERLGRKAEASSKYSKAMKALEYRLDENPNLIKVKLDIAFTHLFLNSEERGKREFFELEKRYPNNPEVQNYRQIFEQFDRETFIIMMTE